MSDASTKEEQARISALRRELHEKLVSALDFGAAERLGRADLESECSARADALARKLGSSLGEQEQRTLVKGVLDDMFRLGPL